MTEKLNARQWVLIGLLIRLAVMPFTLHGDMFFIHEAPHLLVHGEGNAYGVATAKNNLGYYPPFTLIFFAFMQFVFRFVSPDYEEFLHKIGSLEFAPLESEHLFLSLFMLKMPYLIFDFLILHFCWKMISTGQKRRIFAVFWSLNPLVIYGSYMAGQLDILPSFFVVLACYLCLQKGKGNWAALAIASGCLFKIFPIVFLPLVILIAGRNLKDYVRMAICGALPVILVYYMFYLISGDSVIKLLSRHSYNMRSAVDYKDLVIRFFQAGAYMLVCAHVLSFRQKRLDYEKLARCFLVVYLAVYWNLIIHWTHYLIWFTPFMILFVVESPERKRICYCFR